MKTTKLTHDETNTRLEFGVHTLGTTKVDEINVAMQNLIAVSSHFNDNDGMDFNSQRIHVLAPGDVTAEIVNYDTTGPHCVVKLDDHANLYLPMNVVWAIADASNLYDLDSVA